MSQKDIFLSGEADKWYERNSAFDYHKIVDNLEHVLDYIPEGGNVLEIGCSSGRNAYTLSKELKASYYGIDPSLEAVEAAKKVYPKMTFNLGTADLIEHDSGKFDIVYFGFCLYLVDRELLTKVVSEVDRVLKTGGFLIITDFDSSIPRINEYVHKEGVRSYKYKYEEMFLGFPQYVLVDKRPQKNIGFKYDNNERIATTILHKENFNY